MSATKRQNGRFNVGDWVTFPYGTRNAVAQIVEDRGPLGVDRRRLYRIRFDRGSAEFDSFEMPDDELEAIAPPDKAAVLSYLKEGGLVSILRSNLGGGKDKPKVWLTYTPRGGVTHTFLAERGIVGGAVVPFFALHEDKVFAGKKDAVLALLESFDLTRLDSEEVLAAVGTAP